MNLIIEKKQLVDFDQKSILRVFNPLEGEISLHWRAMGKGRTRISSSSRPPHSFLPSLARKFTFTSRGLRVSVFPRKFPRGRYDGCINNTGVSEFLFGLHAGLLATLYIPSDCALFSSCFHALYLGHPVNIRSSKVFILPSKFYLEGDRRDFVRVSLSTPIYTQ